MPLSYTDLLFNHMKAFANDRCVPKGIAALLRDGSDEIRRLVLERNTMREYNATLAKTCIDQCETIRELTAKAGGYKALSNLLRKVRDNLYVQIRELKSDRGRWHLLADLRLDDLKRMSARFHWLMQRRDTLIEALDLPSWDASKQMRVNAAIDALRNAAQQ